MSTRLIPNNGSTTDTSPEIRVEIPVPLRPGYSVHVFRDLTDLGPAIPLNPVTFTWTDQALPGTYTYTARLFLGVVPYTPSPEYIITIAAPAEPNVPPDHTWASLANADGGYAAGNTGTEQNNDANYNDSFWIGVLNTVPPGATPSWDVQWTPNPNDVEPSPVTTVLPPSGNSPWRLHITDVAGPVSAYKSGKMRFALRINGLLTGVRDLQLVMTSAGGYGGYGLETATWGPYVEDAPLFAGFSIDYANGANNGNIKTTSDITSAGGVATPGVAWYFIKNGLDVSASYSINMVAPPNSVLQAGDTVVLQAALHRSTLQSRPADGATGGNGVPIVPLPVSAVQATQVVGISSALQGTSLGADDLGWVQLKSDCGYPAENSNTYSVACNPVINPDGYCLIAYAPFFLIDAGTMNATNSGTILTSTLNGIAVYRGPILPENLIYRRVKLNLYTLLTEIRR